MTSQELATQLVAKHHEFVKYIGSLSEAEYIYNAPEKWSAGQQMEHIHKSVVPVLLAFRLPDFLLGWIFGKANRPSRSYDELVAKYQARLTAAKVIPPKQFQPKIQPFDNREKLVENLQSTVAKLGRLLENKSDTVLDTYVLPHPLLGKLTLREMLYFTVYHVQHHENLVKKYLNQHN